MVYLCSNRPLPAVCSNSSEGPGFAGQPIDRQQVLRGQAAYALNLGRQLHRSSKLLRSQDHLMVVSRETHVYGV